MSDYLEIRKKDPSDIVIALVGSPNVGKSTLFNALTGCNQHTGNWPGKTVTIAQGRYRYKGRSYILVDLPGTYSLVSQSPEEKVTTDFLISGQADCALVVIDATCLERTLLPALQIMELTDRFAVCVNLLDEAERHGREVDIPSLEHQLGVPVVGTAAGMSRGLDRLQEMIRNLTDGFLPLHPKKVPMEKEISLFEWGQGRTDRITSAYSKYASQITKRVITDSKNWTPSLLDRIALGKYSGYILLAVLLLFIFWLTIKAANVPSMMLQTVFERLKNVLNIWLQTWPGWLSGILLDGIFETAACVISVMLPPLLIFFPIFSLLEDFGYLPRVAFLMDHGFQRCGSCGKQALTMAMGFGCNAVGVTGSRIISSKKERLIAIVTNSMVPCNGRFPTMIVLIGIFFTDNDLIAALLLTIFIVLGVAATFLGSKLLSETVFYHEQSHMILELPQYRRPSVKNILSKALVDRVLSILMRAVAVSAPAGAVIWILQNVHWQDKSLLMCLAGFLDPIGLCLGMNGIILTAFILSIPANELLIPSLLMMLRVGMPAEMADISLEMLLLSNGWTMKTAICTLVFLVFHWPCSTTCLTIRKETGSWRWTMAAIVLPLFIGIFLCGLISNM